MCCVLRVRNIVSRTHLPDKPPHDGGGFEVRVGRLQAIACSAIAAGMALICPDARAQAAMENERKCEICHLTDSFLMELAETQEKQTFQATLSSEYNSGRHGREIQLPVSLAYGINDSWEVGVDWRAWGYSREDGEPGVRGIGELELNSKHTFSLGDPRNHLAAGVEFTIPTDKLSGDSISCKPSLMFGRDFPGGHLFSELAFNWVQKIRNSGMSSHAPAAHEIFVGAGALVPVGDFYLSGEITWNNNQWNHGGTVNEIYLAPGATWTITGAWKCGVAVPVGLNARSDRFQVITRVMFEF
jgi:hypothetical protein